MSKLHYVIWGNGPREPPDLLKGIRRKMSKQFIGAINQVDIHTTIVAEESPFPS
jgi:hypothetical protein